LATRKIKALRTPVLKEEQVKRRISSRPCSTVTVSAATFVLALLSLLIGSAQLAAQPTFNVLYTFTGGPDGGLPNGRLVRDADGNLYGATISGGNTQNCFFGCGVIYKLDPAGNETVLYTFVGINDGLNPSGGLIRDAAGNLYGTTGGDVSHLGRCNPNSINCGSVYKLDTSQTYKVLHRFEQFPDGALPDARLVMDAQGNLYGTAPQGGATGLCNGDGCGVVFKIDTAGNFSVLHSFTGADGTTPNAGLVLDSRGTLYGTTSYGGDFHSGSVGCGVVFALAPSGKLKVLYRFKGSPTTDGCYPRSSVTLDGRGSLYGTTVYGGTHGFGTVFRVDTSGKEIASYNFTGSDDSFPFAGVLVVPQQSSYLFGAATGSADGSPGRIYRVTPDSTEQAVYQFTRGNDGADPDSDLILSENAFYGTAATGGQFGWGTVFRIDVP
jgi:uncharacterized repeat protein (TIGR03803 family)